MKRRGWTSRWEDLGSDSIEIFTSPDGHEFIRTGKGERPDLVLPMRHGLAPFRLTNIDHWKAPVLA